MNPKKLHLFVPFTGGHANAHEFARSVRDGLACHLRAEAANG